MKPIDILDRMNAFDDRHFIDMARQRQLDQYAVYARIIVQFVDKLKYFDFRGVVGQVVIQG